MWAHVIQLAVKDFIKLNGRKVLEGVTVKTIRTYITKLPAIHYTY